MIARLKRVNHGRLRVWWIHHGQEAIRAAQLTTIAVIFLVVSSFDYQDQIDQERAAHAAIAETLRRERAARGLPRTTFVIEAKTPQEASMRLAEIASDADVQRLTLRGMK